MAIQDIVVVTSGMKSVLSPTNQYFWKPEKPVIINFNYI